MEIGLTGKFKRDALESDYEDNSVSDYGSYDEAEQKTYSHLAQAVTITYILSSILYVVVPIIIILLRSCFCEHSKVRSGVTFQLFCILVSWFCIYTRENF